MSWMLLSCEEMQDSSAIYILDSWPIMEWIQHREPSTTAMDKLLQSAMKGHARLLISEINYGEVLYACWRKFPPLESMRVLADIEALPIENVKTDHLLVEEASRIKAIVSASYADCFAAALALRSRAALVTGDPELLKVSTAFTLRLHWLGA